MEIVPESSSSMALRCLVEHSRSADNDTTGPESAVKFAIVPGSVPIAELLRFVLIHLDIKANPADCSAQLLLPHWKGLSLSDICSHPDVTPAVNLLSQISNIATLRIILPAQDESSVLPSSVMRSLLRSLIPQHTCSLATQIAWFRQAGCPLSDSLIEAFLASPEDFEFAYRVRREFSDWHSRVCLQYLEQVSRGCQPLVAFTLHAVPAAVQQQQPPQPPPLPLMPQPPLSDAAGGEIEEEADAADGGAADEGEDAEETKASAITAVSALGRLTEHFRSTASRQRLKAARAAAAAAAVSASAVTASTHMEDEDTALLSPSNHDSNSNEHQQILFPQLSQLHHQQQRNSAAASPEPQTASLAGDKRRRTRVFIDPATEIPQLEAWFSLESHPTSAQFSQYARVLNSMPFRQKQPGLEAKNVQLWFKNHRAKVKRERLDVGTLNNAAPAAAAGAPAVASADGVGGGSSGLSLSLIPSSPSSSHSADAETVEAETEAADAEVPGSELLGVMKLQASV